MLTIGLTGGFASGKSTVARCFSARGVPLLDTDIIASELVAPGQPALREIQAVFGAKALDAEGRLNRAWLRQQVFTDPDQRLRLEAILHPRIYQAVIERLPTLHGPYCLLVIPLLLECAQDYPIDRVLLVDSPEPLQYQRAAERDGLSRNMTAAILSSQATRTERLAAADDVIANNADLPSLERQVEQLHNKYLDLARHQH